MRSNTIRRASVDLLSKSS